MLDRPKLKGKIHLAATIVYTILSYLVFADIPRELYTIVIVYLVAVVGHFLMSSILHMIDWNGGIIKMIRTMDHITIFIKIISTYCIYMSTVLRYDRDILYSLLINSLLGISFRIVRPNAPTYIHIIPYLLAGWSILADTDSIIQMNRRLPELSLLTLFSGIFYSIGALVYCFKKPNLFPGYFEFHELFHLISTIATSLMFYGIFYYAIPYYKNSMIIY